MKLTITGVQAVEVQGASITVHGADLKVSNSERRWWQVWKPSMVAAPKTNFTVVSL